MAENGGVYVGEGGTSTGWWGTDMASSSSSEGEGQGNGGGVVVRRSSVRVCSSE